MYVGHVEIRPVSTGKIWISPMCLICTSISHEFLGRVMSGNKTPSSGTCLAISSPKENMNMSLLVSPSPPPVKILVCTG